MSEMPLVKFEKLKKSQKSLGKIETAMKRRVTVEKTRALICKKLATFLSDFGALKGEVFFSKSDHSKNYSGSQLFLDI